MKHIEKTSPIFKTFDIKGHYQESEKLIHIVGENILQIIYFSKIQYPEYIKVLLKQQQQ